MIKKKLKITSTFIARWQGLVDTIAELMNVPAGLIMRVVEKDIQVFVSSNSEGNPYSPGDSEVLLNSGLYCETVIKTNNKLLVPNALSDAVWKNNPDVKLNMISYLGFPVKLPNGKSFGTICILDNKENFYSDLFVKLMSNFRDIIENNLSMIYMNHELGNDNKRLMDFIAEYKHLRGLLHICAKCKKIKNENNEWVSIESYIEGHSEAEFSHGLCEVCNEELYGDKEWFIKEKLNKAIKQI